MDISTIMIVDDNEADQYLTQLVIEEYDANIMILQAYDGEEALAKLAKLDSQPDLILLDINMPRMTGFEFLEKYSNKNSQATDIVMLTSSDEASDRENAKKYECVRSYFTKPVEIEDFKSLDGL